MSRLAWIKDNDLDECIDTLRERISKAHNLASKRVIKNVPDPFWLLCVANLYNINNPKDLLNAQMASSVSTSVASAIGDFHQRVLGKVSGFVNHDAGYDIESFRRKILAEIKNKHNTMNASNRTAVVNNLKTMLSAKPGYDAYLVIIVPSKPERYHITLGRNLHEVDGASFYEMATGSKSALQDLHRVLANELCASIPKILTYILNEYHKSLPK